MSKSNKKSEKKSYYFSILCFSTDIEEYQPMKLIKQYLTLEQCSNIKYDKENGVEYDHSSNAANGRMTKCKFIQILNLEKSSAKASFADSYLIFLNLESENLNNKIEEILSFLNYHGTIDLNIYIIGIYVDQNNVSILHSKQEMISYFNDKKINYEYKELNYNSSNELIKLLSYISNDTLKNKTYDTMNLTMDKEKGKEKSKCVIF